jgi:hypothetical protein
LFRVCTPERDKEVRLYTHPGVRAYTADTETAEPA